MRGNIPLVPPFNIKRIVLHSCCAPCSAAILAVLLENDITPIVFYYNPNIYPVEEYERRKAENKKYAQSLGLSFFDGDYDHEGWKTKIWDLRGEPERGLRCSSCFRLRLEETARFAHGNECRVFATTLSSSPWKNLDQINDAGVYASKLFPDLAFWAHNWRKGGLSERQAAISKQHGFYRQNYCGCEFSLNSRNLS